MFNLVLGAKLRTALEAEADDYGRQSLETLVREILIDRYAQPCPNGCGCRLEEDPDRHDCACDGPCCMATEWPILAYTEGQST